MRIRSVTTHSIFFASCAVFMVWFLASNQLIEMYAYQGMKKLVVDLGFFISLLFMIFTALIFYSSNQNAPIGILIGILFFNSLMWFFVFHSVSGYSDVGLIFFGWLLFVSPIIIFMLGQRYLKVDFGLPRFCDGLFNIRLEFVLATILALVAFYIYSRMSVSFSFDEAYTRRIRARTELTGLPAYFFTMSLNGIAPLLSFLAMYNKKYIYLIFAFCFVLLGFAFLGIKGPILYFVLMSLIGFYFSRGGQNVVFIILIGTSCLTFFAFIEYFIFDFSFIADLYVRRVALVLPQLQVYFLNYIFNQPDSSFSFLFGSADKVSITFLIGEKYLGDPEANANTISFLTELGNRGITGYFFNILFLLLFYSLLEYFYRISEHKVWLALSILYALLLLEQSYTTAFVSSGIGLSTLLIILFNHRRDKIPI